MTENIGDKSAKVAKRDCLECRIISGLGLIGSSAYVAHHTKKLQQSSRIGQLFSITFASGK